MNAFERTRGGPRRNILAQAKPQERALTRDSLKSIAVRPVLILTTRHRLADVLQSTVDQCEARAQSQTCLFASEPAHTERHCRGSFRCEHEWTDRSKQRPR